VLILLCETIELAIIYAEAQTIVRLSYKKYRRDKGRAARHNKAFVKIIKQVFFDSQELLCSYLIERTIAQGILLYKLNLVVYSCIVQRELVRSLFAAHISKRSILRKSR